MPRWEWQEVRSRTLLARSPQKESLIQEVLMLFYASGPVALDPAPRTGSHIQRPPTPKPELHPEPPSPSQIKAW